MHDVVLVEVQVVVVDEHTQVLVEVTNVRQLVVQDVVDVVEQVDVVEEHTQVEVDVTNV